jgi:hypothetical protein
MSMTKQDKRIDSKNAEREIVLEVGCIYFFWIGGSLSMRWPHWFIWLLLLVVFQSPSEAIAKRPFTFKEMIKIQRVSDPQLSTDGRWVAFTVTAPDLERNTLDSDIWLVPASGGELYLEPGFEESLPDRRGSCSPPGVSV